MKSSHICTASQGCTIRSCLSRHRRVATMRLPRIELASRKEPLALQTAVRAVAAWSPCDLYRLVEGMAVEACRNTTASSVWIGVQTVRADGTGLNTVRSRHCQRVHNGTTAARSSRAKVRHSGLIASVQSRICRIVAPSISGMAEYVAGSPVAAPHVRFGTSDLTGFLRRVARGRA